MRVIHLALLLSLLGSAARADQATIDLSGRVTGASGKHAVYVALWRAEGFLEHPVKQVRLPAGTESTFTFKVAPGRWALSAFEDRNDNGVLDMGHFGPKEPAGFWRAFTGWRKPRFDDVASVVDRNLPNADIALR
jgi:uncharacterized protein (DUF2141 family)